MASDIFPEVLQGLNETSIGFVWILFFARSEAVSTLTHKQTMSAQVANEVMHFIVVAKW